MLIAIATQAHCMYMIDEHYCFVLYDGDKGFETMATEKCDACLLFSIQYSFIG